MGSLNCEYESSGKAKKPLFHGHFLHSLSSLGNARGRLSRTPQVQGGGLFCPKTSCGESASGAPERCPALRLFLML